MDEKPLYQIRNFFVKHPIVVLPLALAVAWLAWRYWQTDMLPEVAKRIAAKAPSLPASAVVDIKDARTSYFAELGQTGDAFGGLNSLLTAIAGALVFSAGFLQYIALKEARANAIQSNRMAEATLRATQRASRALVMFEIENADGLFKGDRPGPYSPRLSFRLQNVAETPAVVQRFWFSVQLERTFVSDLRDFDWSHKQAAPYLIPPKGVIVTPVITDWVVTTDLQERLRLKLTDPRAVRFFFYGKVLYEDVFGNVYERTMCIKIFNNRTYLLKINREVERESVDDHGSVEADDTEPS